MALHTVTLPTLVIVNGSSYSQAIGEIDDAVSINIYAPATLTGTITLEVEPSTTGTSFVTQQSGGSDVTLPASKATALSRLPAKQLRLASAASEGGARSFAVTKQIEV